MKLSFVSRLFILICLFAAPFWASRSSAQNNKQHILNFFNQVEWSFVGDGFMKANMLFAEDDKIYVSVSPIGELKTETLYNYLKALSECVEKADAEYSVEDLQLCRLIDDEGMTFIVASEDKRSGNFHFLTLPAKAFVGIVKLNKNEFSKEIANEIMFSVPPALYVDFLNGVSGNGGLFAINGDSLSLSVEVPARELAGMKRAYETYPDKMISTLRDSLFEGDRATMPFVYDFASRYGYKVVLRFYAGDDELCLECEK